MNESAYFLVASHSVRVKSVCKFRYVHCQQDGMQSSRATDEPVNMLPALGCDTHNLKAFADIIRHFGINLLL